MIFRALLVALMLALAGPLAHAATPAGSIPLTALSHYHWQLHEAVDGSGKPMKELFSQTGAPLQLDFSASRVNASHACNGLGGDYHVVDERLDVAPMMHTMMACADPVLMQRERIMTAMLGSKPTLILSGSREAPLLTLTADDGRTLTFQGVPTAATRYGSAGETVFLEVAPDAVPCHHPLMPKAHCLRVRELHYDTQGLRSGTPGPWQVLAQEIEGFSHRPGEHNVLRVKRYTLHDDTLHHVPADAPSVAYELDMVVESGLPGKNAATSPR